MKSFVHPNQPIETAEAKLVEFARNAQAIWRETPLRRRLESIRRFRTLLVENALNMANASALARSRPPAEAMAAEVIPLVEASRFLERKARGILGPRALRRKTFLSRLGITSTQIFREPFGVVLIIGPGNYPLFLPGVQLIQALVAGNAVVIKPGVNGSMAMHALRKLLVEAGIAPDLISILPESVTSAQAALQAGPDKVIFTGSAETGSQILQQIAPHLTPATMELSGSDPVLVRDDADLNLTARALTFGLRLNGGATCMAPKRVFVHGRIATELEGRLADMFKSEERTLQTDKLPLAAVVQETIARGAHLIAGKVTDDGDLVTPIVLGGVPPDAAILSADIFAPVMAIVTVADDAEAVQRANESPYALGASIFTRDASAAHALASKVRAGIITINNLIIPSADPSIPFGGQKRSGFGVTRGAEGLLGLTYPKVITVTRGQFRPSLEPINPSQGNLFQSYLTLIHGRGFKKRVAAFLSLIKNLKKERR